jgi:hypothetical protein
MNKQQRLLWCLGVTVVAASAHGRFRRGGGAAWEPFGTAPVRTDGCPWENDPVECRFPPDPSSRIYSSICFASRAGYEIEHCLSTHRSKGDPSSAEPESSLACLSVTGLVCESETKFANLCLAQVSGYRAKDCTALTSDERRLRNLQSDAEDVVFCPMWYQPVYCTLSGIQFPSDCEAGAAGYSLHDCTVPEGGDITACPPTGQGVVGPVSCNGTDYDSICLASAANHTPTQDCSLAVTSDPLVQTASTRKCAKSGKVQCGKRGREFDNFCQARKAGFTRKKCHSV